jgi:uncharacterized membrane protein HdeD (DUF308 family)
MQIILFIVFGIINALIASKKSFNPWIWFFAGGLLGLIAILILPSAHAALPDQELYEQRRKTSNTAGIVILCIALFAILILMAYIGSL